MVVSSLDFDQGDEDMQTDVFSMRDPSWASDSSIHQRRNTQVGHFNNYAHNSLIWKVTPELKVQYISRISHSYQLRDIQARLLEGGSFAHQHELSNYQSTNLINIPLSVNPEYTFSNGLYLSPSIELGNNWLSGHLNPGTPAITRFDALLHPRMQVGYINDKVGSLKLGYRLYYQQPSIAQLNPDPYYSTPYDVQIGHPDLSNSYRNIFDFQYAHYFRKVMLNVSVMSNFTNIKRSVVADRQTEIDPEANMLKTTIRYLSVAGGDRQEHRISLTKTIRKMNSTLTYQGTINAGTTPYFLNGKQEERQSFSQQHRLSFFYSPTKWLEFTPQLAYQAIDDRSSLRTFAGNIYNRVFTADLKPGVFLPLDLQINGNLSHSLHETTNIMTNTSPFVVNANIEKRVFKAKNGILSFVVMDLARQNAFTNYTSNEMGYTNTLSNMESRYFLLQFSWQPQFWGRSKHDPGQGRRGDGSFTQ